MGGSVLGRRRADVEAGSHGLHYCSRLLDEVSHYPDVVPEPRVLSSFAYGHDAQPVPKRSAVFPEVEHGGLDLFVGVELGLYALDGLVVCVGAIGSGRDV